jgi:hypothetical protein
MTISKKVRAYLAKNPDATARDIHAKFGASLPMAYRLVKENKDRLAAKQEEKDLDSPLEIGVNIDKIHSLLDSLPGVQSIDIREPRPVDNVNHPPHYTIGGIETIDFIEAKGLHNHYHLANAVKYISRAPYKKDYLEDIKKAAWYLQREIELQEKTSPIV